MILTQLTGIGPNVTFMIYHYITFQKILYLRIYEFCLLSSKYRKNADIAAYFREKNIILICNDNVNVWLWHSSATKHL